MINIELNEIYLSLLLVIARTVHFPGKTEISNFDNVLVGKEHISGR